MRVLLRILRLLNSFAHELSDQNAYGRYLQQRGQSHSAEAWQRFSEGRYRKRFGNAKCC